MTQGRLSISSNIRKARFAHLPNNSNVFAVVDIARFIGEDNSQTAYLNTPPSPVTFFRMGKYDIRKPHPTENDNLVRPLFTPTYFH